MTYQRRPEAPLYTAIHHCQLTTGLCRSDRLDQASVSVGDDQLDAGQAASHRTLQAAADLPGALAAEVATAARAAFVDGMARRPYVQRRLRRPRGLPGPARGRPRGAGPPTPSTHTSAYGPSANQGQLFAAVHPHARPVSPAAPGASTWRPESLTGLIEEQIQAPRSAAVVPLAASSSRSMARCPGDQHRPAVAAQQQRHFRQGVVDPEQPPDQRGHPTQPPLLVIGIAVRGRTAIQLGPQPRKGLIVRPRPTVRPPGPQRLGPTLTPGSPPLLHLPQPGS